MVAIVVVAWIILGLQIITITAFLAAFWKKRQQPAGNLSGVSVIVCAHDEEANLRRLIPLLLQQDYPEFEVIIVEDRSNDGTYDMLLEETRKHSKLKMVRVQHLPEHVHGKKYALTLGIKAASHEWLLLTDADCRPGSDQWIKSIAASCQDNRQIVIGFSPFERGSGYLNTFIRFESLITGIQFMGWALLGRPYMGTGRNLAYRKSLFLQNKGFNNYLGVTGGDDDLFVNQHANGRNTGVALGVSTLTWSLPKKTWAEFYIQKLRHLFAGRRYKFMDKLILGSFSLGWILTWFMALPFMLRPEGIAYYLWTGFVLREMLLIALIRRASRTLGEPYEAWKTPFLDFNYAIYYLGTGLVALVSKRVRWKS